jgi:hypothetical protein
MRRSSLRYVSILFDSNKVSIFSLFGIIFVGDILRLIEFTNEAFFEWSSGVGNSFPSIFWLLLRCERPGEPVLYRVPKKLRWSHRLHETQKIIFSLELWIQRWSIFLVPPFWRNCETYVFFQQFSFLLGGDKSVQIVVLISVRLQ